MSWTYGIVLNLIGSVLINGGTNLMKLGHMQFSKNRCDENKEEDEIRQEASKLFRNRISPRDRSEGDNCSVITRESSSSSSTSDYKRNLSGKAADKEKDENPSSAKKGKVWYAGSFFFVFAFCELFYNVLHIQQGGDHIFQKVNIAVNKGYGVVDFMGDARS